MEHLSDAEMADKIRAQMPEFNVVPGFSGVAADASSAADAVAPELPEAGAGFTGRLAAADNDVRSNERRSGLRRPAERRRRRRAGRGPAHRDRVGRRKDHRAARLTERLAK